MILELWLHIDHNSKITRQVASQSVAVAFT